MSAEAEASQTEAQAAQVELEYHREEKRENKAMDAKLVTPKFNPNLIVRAYVDNFSNGSAKSGAGDRQHPAALFLTHASTRVAVPIVEPILSGEYPQMDKNWGFWMSSTNPNSHRLTDHDKCVVESFNHIIRHQNTKLTWHPCSRSSSTLPRSTTPPNQRCMILDRNGSKMQITSCIQRF